MFLLLPFNFQTVKPLLEQLGAELSETEDSPEEGEKTATVERKAAVKEELDDAVPPHALLDVSVVKSKAELATRGGLANRQLPTSKKGGGGLSNSSSDYGLSATDDSGGDGSSDCEEQQQQQQLSTIAATSATSITSSSSTASSIYHHQQQVTRHRHMSSSSVSSTVASHVAWTHSIPQQTEQLKQVLAERERRLEQNGGAATSSMPLNLVEEIRQAVNQANAKGQ
ncbi:hypothetical protein AAG570_013406 [Ranatra chinensis]|uniref:Uncharacterized protein n=1 Tax=Ranatra chinensis TaxID=642074 RepID=A0ABD0YQV2_9HEMI